MTNVPGPLSYGPWRPRKVFVLCFDGTGNKFQGNAGDSNTGIGTYVSSTSYSHTGVAARLSSWYKKAKDSAIGSSFADHVMGGYKFLMQHYATGDDLYFFGFSRGAYTARFLAEMLDHVGLLGAGNEELVRFAWKAFAQWQQRPTGEDEEGRKKKIEMFNFMKAFRETFSRPVRRIRFLGLFDTVNSVPAFEAAWLQRKSKFPYTARSSALVIRHAVAIDERRAKFRQDLIAPTNTTAHTEEHRRMALREWARRLSRRPPAVTNGSITRENHGGPKTEDRSSAILSPMDHDRFRRPSRAREPNRSEDGASMQDRQGFQGARGRSRTPVGGLAAHRGRSASNIASHGGSQISLPLSVAAAHRDDADSDDGEEQDIEEVWFPGNHADVGGGWAMGPEEHSLSHAPLVWMVREARRAGLELDETRMAQLMVMDEDLQALTSFHFPHEEHDPNRHPIPQLHVSRASEQQTPTMATQTTPQSTFADKMHDAVTKSKLHDCLEYGHGLPATSVVAWKIMEYMPFRRMDLQPEGWKAVRWPLPMGEVRDIPETAWIHVSALRRMETDAEYRPGNLIVGGGGRGVRRAPPEYGTGEWTVVKGQGDIIGGVVVRKKETEQPTDDQEKSGD
ncbi:MAG: hypothetical protein M1817_003420 [Caeruleum heppii]|nr:MAG: hypothetical protein M1817_003420 [Caeruleum heppii]